jgi:hypothetical protein
MLLLRCREESVPQTGPTMQPLGGLFDTYTSLHNKPETWNKGRWEIAPPPPSRLLLTVGCCRLNRSTFTQSSMSGNRGQWGAWRDVLQPTDCPYVAGDKVLQKCPSKLQNLKL